MLPTKIIPGSALISIGLVMRLCVVAGNLSEGKLGNLPGRLVMAEPSLWHLSRLVIEREGYRVAQQTALEARRSYREALVAARRAGWTYRALQDRLGVDKAQLCRDARRGSADGLDDAVAPLTASE